MPLKFLILKIDKKNTILSKIKSDAKVFKVLSKTLIALYSFKYNMVSYALLKEC